MIINNGILLHIDETDLDSDGVLRIPARATGIADGVGNGILGLRTIHFPDTMYRISGRVFNDNPNLETIYFGEGINNINPTSFSNCPALSTVQIPHKWKNMQTLRHGINRLIRRDRHGNVQTWPIRLIRGTYYYESMRRNIGRIAIIKLHPTNFDDTGISPEYKIGLQIHDAIFIGNNLHNASDNYRRHCLMQEFERKVYIYNAKNPDTENIDESIAILRDALRRTIICADTIGITQRDNIRKHIRAVPVYIGQIRAFMSKYPNACDEIQELDALSIEQLSKIISPRPRTPRVNQSCTRWLKKHPVSVAEMNAIVRAGYKNPGAFPYTWLQNTPISERGKLTRALHKLFRTATAQMYTPYDAAPLTYYANQTAIKMSRLIKQPVSIQYLESGNFAKAYIIQTPNAEKYVWKIYHCDRMGKTFTDWNHDTELQNSFLVSGKKYYGKIKFRKISTAGISNQRGEIYLIYPYTEPGLKIHTTRTVSPTLTSFNIYDTNAANFCGDTLIDIGALNINTARISQPRYVLKIMNTVLYHSWGDLTYILNKYTPQQIKTAGRFIRNAMTSKDFQYKQIREKLIYLRDSLRER